MRAIQFQNDSGENLFVFVNQESQPAEITVEVGDASISISLEDAEMLAEELKDLVQRAKEGRE